MHYLIYSITATAVYKVSYLQWIFSVLLQIDICLSTVSVSEMKVHHIYSVTAISQKNKNS